MQTSSSYLGRRALVFPEVDKNIVVNRPTREDVQTQNLRFSPNRHLREFKFLVKYESLSIFIGNFKKIQHAQQVWKLVNPLDPELRAWKQKNNNIL